MLNRGRRYIGQWQRLLAGACLTLAGFAAHAQEDLLGRALEDLQAGDAKAAFERLAPEQGRRAGDPNYDYLLGVSALGAGRNTEAIFALERVLALRPQDINARVAMGRAHLALQETEAARREFTTVQALDRSEATRAAIQRYLNLTDQIEAAGRFAAQIWLEFAVGHDSNVNSASSLQQVAIPGLGGQSFTISEGSRAQSDGFLNFAAGVNLRYRTSPRTTVVGGLALSQRFYAYESQYESDTVDFSLGLNHSRGLNLFSVALQAGQININHSDYVQGYRDSLGTTLQWTRSLEGNAQVSAYYQVALLDYPGQEPRDAMRHVLGAAYARGFDSGLSAYAGLYGGIEKEDKAEYAYLGHELGGGRLGADYALSNRLSLFANGSYEYRRYRDEDPSFLRVRHERQYGAALGLNYALTAPGWRLTPQISYMKTDSNIDVNSYSRWVAQMAVRGDL